MLRPRIIPCLLMSKKGLIKTVKFNNPKYIGDPINAVKIFNEKKVDELILLDIDASRNKVKPDFKILKVIANESRMPLTYGGGISTVEDAKQIISLGFEKISVSHSAIKDINFIRDLSNEVGSQSVVFCLDYKKNFFSKKNIIYSINSKIKHNLNILDLAKKAEDLGAGEIMFNSIDRDGTMQGYDIEFAQKIRNIISTQISFLGGASNSNSIEELYKKIGIGGFAAGSMFVFKGKFRAVLLSYERPNILKTNLND